MATVPADELRAIAERYGTGYCLEGDPTSAWVRVLAASIRPAVTSASGVAEADELDALADKYEQEGVAL